VGWLVFSRLLRSLEAELASIENRSKVLEGLLASGRVSPEAYIQLNERLKSLSSKIQSLKRSLEEERSFQSSSVEECVKVLELLLVDLRCRHMLGEVGDGEWDDKSRILIEGIRSLKDGVSSSAEELKESTPPDFFVPVSKTEFSFTFEGQASRSVGYPKRRLKASRKKRKRAKSKAEASALEADRKVKAPPEIEASQAGIHCRNPWKKDCRNTDIELTIYYNGELLPICRECWREISEKNIEWSSY